MNKPKTSHTPGPWEVFESHTGIYILDSAEQAAVCRLEWCLEAEANARLIAAAPDLLAALKGIFEHCAMIHRAWGDGSNHKEADAAIAAGKAAIAKAEGEG